MVADLLWPGQSVTGACRLASEWSPDRDTDSKTKKGIVNKEITPHAKSDKNRLELKGLLKG